jgi:hypothetical protein
MAHDYSDPSTSGGPRWHRSVRVVGVTVLAFALGFITARLLDDGSSEWHESARALDNAARSVEAAARSLDDDPSDSYDTTPDVDVTVPEGSESRSPGTEVVDLFDSPTQPDELPEVKLVVHTDGCGVIRPEIAEPPHGFTWSVRDLDGFTVLGRNALNETHYRYFRPGTYTVVLEAWDGEKYAAISNVVTINC